METSTRLMALGGFLLMRIHLETALVEITHFDEDETWTKDFHGTNNILIHKIKLYFQSPFHSQMQHSENKKYNKTSNIVKYYWIFK